MGASPTGGGWWGCLVRWSSFLFGMAVFCTLTNAFLLGCYQAVLLNVQKDDSISWFSILCPSSSLIMFFSPISIVLGALSSGNAGILPVPLFFAGLVQNAFNIGYAVKTDNNALLMTNVAAGCMNMTWIAAWHHIRTWSVVVKEVSVKGKGADGTPGRTPMAFTPGGPASGDEGAGGEDTRRRQSQRGQGGGTGRERRGLIGWLLAFTGVQYAYVLMVSVFGQRKQAQGRSGGKYGRVAAGEGTDGARSGGDSSGGGLFSVLNMRGLLLLAVEWTKFGAVLSLTLGTVAGLSLMLTTEEVGIAAVTATFGMFLPPVMNMGRIIRAKDSRAIPLGLSISMLMCNFLWALFGLVLGDVVVWLPSVCGFGFCAVQLLVWGYCRGFWLPVDISTLALLYPASPESVGAVGGDKVRRGSAADGPSTGVGLGSAPMKSPPKKVETPPLPTVALTHKI
uniref:Uncharacterized protein n=1 Tax=Chromera velia CCMP2878 TaxID=1169474 RepID=A0A0G4GI25_9ALVE|eukprot:Cvel_21979.t1-p1 / transcript=Cvel_21979.t1 / gene=Cvel_21979 / organism=Chromera_velia_CCMP2878 / gene_product=Bidirectional sugar transporter SWEET13, putative / transcript_product=Bidirectional sugar transporter SWEET13, putative / location=Cvel_scaffold2115:27074-29761(-) / protein_length=450 / sequence_SO=supercontig / SO=protein_coding / is_pseudo=false